MGLKMKSFFIIIVLLASSSLANPTAVAKPAYVKPVYTNKTIKVAVIDTGFDFQSKWKNLIADKDGVQLRQPNLCNEGHKDFSGSDLIDRVGHGTHVAGIIAKFAENADYCLVIIKFFDPSVKNSNNLKNSAAALKYAYSLGVDIINYSGGGTEFSLDEYLIVKKLLERGTVFVAAAGNEKSVNDYKVLRVDINHNHDASDNQAIYDYKIYFINTVSGKIINKAPTMYYPADYDSRIISVGNKYLNQFTKVMEVSPSSNRGDAINFKEKGTAILSILPNNSVGYMTGTSQASPTRVGKMLKMWNNK